MFGLSANGQFSTDFTLAVKATSTAIGNLIPVIIKIEALRTSLNADATAMIKYDLITVRLYLTSYKAFIDRLGTYASGTMPTPTTSAIINEVKVDINNLSVFGMALKTALTNIDMALKPVPTLTSSFPADESVTSFTTALTNIFTATTSLIGTPMLTPAMINMALGTMDPAAANKYFTTFTTSAG